MKKRPLKIGICIDFFYDAVAGAEANSLELARALREREHVVEIICSRSFLSPKIPPDPSFLIRHAAGLYHMRELSRVMPTKLLADFCYQFPGWLFRTSVAKILIENKYDVIYTYSYDLLRAAKEKNIETPVVLTLLNPIGPKYLPLLNRPNQITCVGRLLQKEIKQKFKIDSIYAPPAIDLKKFKPLSKSKRRILRRKMNLRLESKALLFCNRLIPFKNCETLVRAMPQIIRKEPKVRLLILGHGVLEKLLKKLVIDLHLEKYVFFLGTVTIDELNEYFNIADLVVVPSFYESCSMVSVEALAARRPLLISEGMDEFRHLFPDVETANPKSPADIAQKILKLLNSEVSKINLKNLKYFDLPRLTGLYEKIFYKVTVSK